MTRLIWNVILASFCDKELLRMPFNITEKVCNRIIARGQCTSNFWQKSIAPMRDLIFFYCFFVVRKFTLFMQILSRTRLRVVKNVLFLPASYCLLCFATLCNSLFVNVMMLWASKNRFFLSIEPFYDVYYQVEVAESSNRRGRSGP